LYNPGLAYANRPSASMRAMQSEPCSTSATEAALAGLELLERLLALGDVARGPQDAVDATVDDDGDHAQLVPARAAVVPVAGVLVDDRLAHLDHLAELRRQACLGVLAHRKVPDLGADNLVPSERLDDAVDEEHGARGVQDEDHVGRGRDKGAPVDAVQIPAVRSHAHPC
jgi:hypothetical protein